LNIRLHKQNAGVALIVVMIAITVLSMMAAMFAFSMKVETKLAANANSEQQLLWLGRSGVELARYVVSEQLRVPNQPYDSLNQVWAGGPGGDSSTNSSLSGLSLDNYAIGDGTVSVKIIDLERKVNVNSANGQIIQQALTLMGVDASDISVISDSIQDWVGPGDAPRVAGAKSDFYQSLTPPYYCKDAPMDDLTELLLVRGILDHPEIYWGGSASNHQGAVFQHKLGFGNSPGEEPDYPFGLSEIFTPFSTGKININTADATVLQMIPGVDADTAEAIIKQRAGPDGADGTDDDIPYRSPSQIGAAGVNPQLAAQIGNYCTVRSSTFEVHVTAQVGLVSREYVAILYRPGNSPDVQVVRFYWINPNAAKLQ
jgi:general secretion pathway protein K